MTRFKPRLSGIVRSRHPVFAFLAVIALVAGAVQAQEKPTETEKAKAETFDDYAIIVTRSVFDPNRRKDQPAEGRVEQVEPAAQNEHMDLLGALVYDGGAVAFFEGSHSSCTGVFHVGDKIAEGTIVAIDVNAVRLSRDEKETVLPIGERLAWSAGGEWKQESTPAQLPAVSASSESTRNDAATSETQKGGDDAADLLRKMMERRKQELGK